MTAECFAGAAVGLGVEAFDYNRENFHYDRDQRLEKEFTTMEMRIKQAGQWREDVSDLVSLTEKKMHIYLLSTILLVLVTVFLWCEVEDTLDLETPRWLIAGFAMALTGAFLFLLLSIWLAIHAAVCAQGYSARLRTQMVRLPIPSWEEVEACRTYGSQFEKMEGRQMFRVPFVMGRQENLVSAAPGDEANGGMQVPDDDSSLRDSPSRRGDSTASLGGHAEKSKVNFNDPWGLERTGDQTAGLGKPLGADVADLRHVKITRQVAKLWQTYDAFARVALTIGINQLILTLSYYYIAYLVIDVDCKGAGVVAVIMLIVMSDACFKIEISLQTWQLTVAQFFGILGPVCGLIAAYRTTTDLSNIVAHWFIPFAFFAHGLYLFFMLYLCKVKTLRSGATVPEAFKQKLYLDVFAWLKQRPLSPIGGLFGLRRGDNETDDFCNQPAIQVMRYKDGKSCPTLPEDFAVAPDMRFEQGACDPAATMSVDSKASIPFCKWEPERTQEGDGIEEVVTGHDAEGPGIFPWVVFSYALTVLSAVWVIAAIWRLEQAIEVTRHAKSWTQLMQMTQSEHVSALLDTGAPLYSQDVRDVLSGNYTPFTHDPAKLSDASLPDVFHLWASSHLGGIISKPWTELVPTTWPHVHFVPRTLSCDPSGQHFIVTDRFAAVEASLIQKDSKDTMQFSEMHCPTLDGEQLQDASLFCATPGARGNCDALVLHRHGKRIASCKLSSAKAASGNAAQPNAVEISESWLERESRRNAEKVSAIASRPYCEGDLAQCILAQTTHGRTVRLRQRSRGHDLVPDEILQEGRPEVNMNRPIASTVLRAFNGRYAGVLHSKRQSIELFDVSRGGLFAGKLLLPPQQHVTSWCAGGKYLFMLSGNQVWRMPLPEKLSVV